MCRSMTGQRASIAIAAVAGLLTAAPALAQMSDHPATEPLAVAAEVGFAPWVMKSPDGSIDGFSVEFARDIAKRIGRPELKVIDTVWANIFAGLYAKKYEYIIGPTTITEKRAAEMLFSEPYIDVALGFLTGKKVTLKTMDDLKGRNIGVTSGSVQDDWMSQNAQKYGIKVQRFDATTDALQAILSGRSDGYMTLMSTGLWTVKRDPTKFSFDLFVHTGQTMALPFRPNDTEFRDQVEFGIECMKKDGSLARIYEKWFGRPPEPNSATLTVYPGRGAPGQNGHVATPYDKECAKPS
jgi:polar amino acid transport system substrate-binding protein